MLHVPKAPVPMTFCFAGEYFWGSPNPEMPLLREHPLLLRKDHSCLCLCLCLCLGLCLCLCLRAHAYAYASAYDAMPAPMPMPMPLPMPYEPVSPMPMPMGTWPSRAPFASAKTVFASAKLPRHWPPKLPSKVVGFSSLAKCM